MDAALRAIAKRRAGLDADEARWIREAVRCEVWKPLGMVSAIDYLERVLGYAPRTAQERLRVARKLGELPEMESELERGSVSYSCVKELSRVATRWTEAEWLAAVEGMNLRQVEELVAERREGDRPTDEPDPSVRRHVITLEVDAETFAAMRQARAVIDEEHGERLDDAQFMAALVARALDGEPGRARAQVAITVCERCRAGWQDGAGAVVPVAASSVERAECDAQHIGSLDAEQPARARQGISPAVARLVWRRDHGRCRVPGCRSARGLELHHIVHREHRGTHELENLVLLCSSCHTAHHERRLFVTGTASDLLVDRPSPRVHVGGLATRTGVHAGARDVALRDDAFAALTTAGWKPHVARRAVDEAISALGPDAALGSLLRAALARCA